MIAAALFIDFTVLFGSNLSWGPKLIIVGISVLGQIVAIGAWLHMKPWPPKSQKGKEKNIFDLSAKLLHDAFVCSNYFLYSRDLGCDPKRRIQH